MYERIGQSGDATATVQLRCALIREHTPVVPRQLPAVQWRMGIDVNPIAVADATATRWVRALIWPEHTDRAAMFERAVAVARRASRLAMPPPCSTALARRLRPTARCASFTATRAQIVTQIEELANKRDLVRVSLEWYGGQAQPQLEMNSYTAAGCQRELLAYCESHGRALEWLGA